MFVLSILKSRAHGLLESKGKLKEGPVYLRGRISCDFTQALALALALEAFYDTAARLFCLVVGILECAYVKLKCCEVMGFLRCGLLGFWEGESLLAGRSPESTRDQATGRVDVTGEEHIAAVAAAAAARKPPVSGNKEPNTWQILVRTLTGRLCRLFIRTPGPTWNI